MNKKLYNLYTLKQIKMYKYKYKHVHLILMHMLY